MTTPRPTPHPQGPKYPQVEVSIPEDANRFTMIKIVSQKMKEKGLYIQTINRFQDEFIASSMHVTERTEYDVSMEVIRRWVSVV